MNQPIAIIVAGLLIAAGIYFAAPRYAFITVTTSTNPAVWKLDTHTGDVALCAAGAGKNTEGKDNESGCSTKFKQF